MLEAKVFLNKRKEWFNSMLPKPKTKRQAQVIDYLCEQREKRKKMEKDDPNYKLK